MLTIFQRALLGLSWICFVSGYYSSDVPAPKLNDVYDGVKKTKINLPLKLNIGTVSDEPLHKCDGIKCENGIVCEKGKCPCETKPGLSGERCEIADGCVALKATCEAISKNCIYDPNTEEKATCDCGDDKKFDGTECKDVCTGNPCKNEGVCTIEGDSFKCNCTKPYLGDTCEKVCDCGGDEVSSGCEFLEGVNGTEIQVCFCKENFAQLGNNCVECDCGGGEVSRGCDFYKDVEDSYQKECYCKDNLEQIGNYCGDVCTNNPCKKEGVCTVEGHSFKCNCKLPYLGDTCEKDVCTDNPCKNEGVCTIKGDSFKCNCKKPYLGETCEKDVCTVNPCKNEGVCTIKEDSFKCNCKIPYLGDTCEKDVCTNSPCKNEGVCTIEGDSFKCNCKLPYLGDTCEKDVCTENPCKNEGVCTIEGDSFKCNCMKPYLGDTCEKDFCTVNPCKNQGVCTIKGDSFKCNCKVPYLGDLCEKDVCTNNPCKNEGVCTIEGDSFKCNCKLPYLGDTCEKDVCTENPCKNEGVCMIEGDSFKCNCKKPYLGHTCEENVCTVNPCKNEGVCTVEGDYFKCNCKLPYLGDTCEKDVCTVNPCKNEGVCKIEGDSFKCSCKLPYLGDTCERDLCTVNPCKNEGMCTIEGDSFKCNCKLPYLGDTCEKDVCTVNPCKNDGVCKIEGDSFKCTCKPPYIGKTCNEDVCTFNPCHNEGSCAIEGDAFKCNCKLPYFGDTCEKDPCKSGVCQNGGLCKIEENKYKCYCKLEHNGTICNNDVQDDDHICSSNPCRNGANCYKNEADYICDCQEGFYGDNCTITQYCKDNKETVCGSVDCVHDEGLNKSFCFCSGNQVFDAKKQICNDIDRCATRLLKNECVSPHEICREGNCECEYGYKYDGSKKKCVFDACFKKPCGNSLTCKDNGDSTYTCSCKEGFVYNGKRCIKMNKCAMGLNCEQLCKDGVCSCAEGFYLNSDKRTCSKDESTSTCEKDCGVGECFLIGEAQKCVCPFASHVEKNGTCSDRCSSLASNTCPSGIKCELDTKLGFRCICNGSRYKQAEDGIHCEVKNMCTEGEGAKKCEEQSAQCVESPKKSLGYECICADGYAKDDSTNTTCTHKCSIAEQVKKCLARLAICEIEVINGKYEAVCNCPPLFTDEGSDKCDQRAENSFTGSFQVKRSFYEIQPNMNSRFKRSTPKIDYIKLNKEFKESLTNVYANFSNSKVLNCSDNGQNLDCSLEMQLKTAFNQAQLDIITAPSVCIPQPGTRYCLVPPRLLVEKNTETGVFSETNPCNADIKNGLCGPTTDCKINEANEPNDKLKDKSFQCQCRDGFVAMRAYKPFPGDSSSIEICKDDDECLKQNICPNSTECFNLYGSYDCLCRSNFRKPEDVSKNIKIDGCDAVCDPNPCKHGTCNTTGNHGFACSCDSSYTGFLCDESNSLVISLKDTLRKNSALIGGILGALLVVAIIVCFILFMKLKGKSVEGEDDYTKHRRLRILSEMTRLGRRQPKAETDDIEVEQRNIPTVIANEDGDYRRQYRDNDFAIPRPQVSQKRESGDYRRGYSGDDQMFQKSSRHPDEAPMHGRRKISRSSERLDAEQRRISLSHYRNDAYEEE